MAPGEVVQAVLDSHLRGRGGAGFPTGRKWTFVPQGEQAVHPTYLVINADEMEPGTFKDRVLLEGNPHQLIEGIIISAYAIQADIAYIFLRQEYVTAARRCSRAIAEAYARGYLGRNILGTDFSLELYLHTSAGRYICGEETALLNALEGRRAIPRAKPPFPLVVGLWGKPTVVNNVETICNVPHISRARGRLVPAIEPIRGRRHQDLRGERPGQEAGDLGVADGRPRSAKFWKSMPAACAMVLNSAD